MDQVKINDESFFKISNVDNMRPFLMSIVSDSNHWMFISSNGGLSAGRKNAENALFPYYTDDKLTESFDTTGSKSIFWVTKNNDSVLWEPFSNRNEGWFSYTRNLYKNTYGNKVIFEEINHDLEISFRYQWSSSNRFGFIKESQLANHSSDTVYVRLIDGIQNIMPYGVSSDFQGIRSNLVDAYKRNELVEHIGLGIFALSAIIVDKAEPSEALKANIAWSSGLDKATSYLLSSNQLDEFRKGNSIKKEIDVKAERGAYFLSGNLDLLPSGDKKWIVVADVNQDASSITEISQLIQFEENIESIIKKDIEVGTQRLVNFVAASDGLQYSADKRRNTRHFSNTLFNIMRGGIFDQNYIIEKWDFCKYLENANNSCFRSNDEILNQLNETFTVQELKVKLEQVSDIDFKRLAVEYMPLKFSRRHGDPSRPWNQFSINTRSESDGSKILDYEGNWRDIFQNWEALVHSYPEFIESMITKFLNASTFDGYNPYRVTKDGFDWETIEPDNPWSYIGYWGDHQIIYLLKFLEFLRDYFPDRLSKMMNEEMFVYANVPYKIKSFEEIVRDPKDTIIFDQQLDKEIREKRDQIGADGALLMKDEAPYKVNFIEKILASALAKLANFIPEGGIWLNTQRPEWNDANNALVGNGVSMVTLYYLRRFLSFFKQELKDLKGAYLVSKELVTCFVVTKFIFKSNIHLLTGQLNNKQRQEILTELGTVNSTYRDRIYTDGFSGKKETINAEVISDFFETVLSYLDHSIKANKRSDGMVHSYNLMSIERDGISISHLDEMLEGQVAVLSSDYLGANECLELLDSLKKSTLFREDQYSYLLYPNKELPGFLQRNNIPSNRVESSPLLKELVTNGNNKIIQKDVVGSYHFNGNFKNADDLKLELKSLNGAYKNHSEDNDKVVLDIFEEVFNHKSFTGRSGTFYGYEGLGSIYWHMVSKLLLAVEECALKAYNNNESDEIIGRLLEHYYEINEGIGVHKSPELYGAFPTDPYSHTPLTKGAQQPGMTGQVKEDILSRKGELGLFVSSGKIHFNPFLLRKEEFLKKEKSFKYIDVNQIKKSILLTKDSLAFTFCQVPIVYKISESNKIVLRLKDDQEIVFPSLKLNPAMSKEIFDRTGTIDSIKVYLRTEILK